MPVNYLLIRGDGCEVYPPAPDLQFLKIDKKLAERLFPEDHTQTPGALLQ